MKGLYPRHSLSFQELERRCVLSANVGVDDFPNEISASACLLTPGQFVEGSLEAPGDKDVFAINVQSNEIVRVTLDSNFALPQIELSPAGTNFRSIANELDSELIWKSTSTGLLYVRVSSPTDTGTYQLTVDTDVDDPDIPQSTGMRRLSDGVSLTGSLQHLGDVDYFSFTANAGDQWLVELDTGEASYYLNSFLYEFNEDRPASPGPGFVLDRATAFTTTLAGTYLVEVKSVANLYPFADDYQVSLTRLVDDHPNEVSDEVETLKVGELLVARATGNDVDVFALDASSENDYVFSLWPGDFARASGASIRAADGQVIYSSRFQPFSWTPETSGRYYLYANVQQNGAYDILMTIAEDDHGDDISSVKTTIEVDDLIEASIDVSNDVDVFGMELEVGQGFRAFLNGPRNNLVIELLDPEGSVIGTSDRMVSWKAERTGRHFLRVIGAEQLVDYSVSVESILDDHPDDIAEATVVSLGDTIAGHTEVANDIDLFAIDLEARQVLRFYSGETSPFRDAKLLANNGSIVPKLPGRDRWHIAETGRYFIEVSSFSTYSFRPDISGSDDFPDVVQPTLATNLTIGEEITGVIEEQDDRDWLVFDAELGQVISFQLDQLGGRSFHLSVADLSGEVLKEERSSTVLTWTAPSNDRYAFGFLAREGDYTVSTEVLLIDDHGNTFEFATPVMAGERVAFQLHDEEDVDMFSYVARAGELISFDVPDRFTIVSVFDSTGQQLFRNSEFWQAATAGPIFVQLSNRNTGEYSFSLVSNGDDVLGVPSLNAPKLRDGQPIVSTFEFENDRDVYSVDAVVGSRYRLVPSGVQANIRVLNLAGEEQELQGDGTGLQWEPGNSGTYYIEMWPTSSRQSGEYSISLEAIVPTPIALGTSFELATGAGTVVFAGFKDQLLQLDIESPVEPVPGLPRHFFVQIHDANNVSVASQVVDSEVAFRIPETGSYFAIVAWLFVDLGGPTTVSLSQITDDHADSSEEATEILAGQTTTGRISHQDDIDVFYLDLASGEVANLDFSKSEQTLTVSVSDSDGEPIHPAGNWKSTEAGRYYITVRGINQPGDYELTTQTIPDDYPDSANLATATVSVGKPLNGAFEFDRDHDAFLLDTVAGETYRISVANQDGDRGLNIQLVGPDGQIITDRGFREFDWKATQDGLHTVVVSSFQRASYAVSLEILPDDHPDEVGLPQTALLSIGTASNVTFEVGDDIDVVAFEAIEADRLRITTRVAPNETNQGFPLVSVYDPVGTLVGEGDAGWPIDLIAMVDGKFYVELVAPDAASSFQVELQAFEDDWNEDNRPLLNLDEPIFGQNEFPADVDTFALDVVAGTIYQIFVASDFQISTEVENENGERQPIRASSGSLDFKAVQSGRYFVRMQSGQISNNYSVRVTAIADDFPNVPSASSVEIQIGETQSGAFEAETDVDVFAFEVESDTVFDFVVRGNVAVHSNLRVLQFEVEDDAYVAIRPNSDGTFRADSTQRYYLELASRSRIGNYEVTLRRLGVDAEPNFPGADVDALTRDGFTQGTFENQSDLDVFAVDAVQGEAFEVAIQDAGSTAWITVYAPDGETIVADNADRLDATLTWKANENGRHYIQFHPRIVFTTLGEYRVQLSNATIFEDSPGGPPSVSIDPMAIDATPVRFGDVLQGEFTAADEQVFFSFEGSAGTVVELLQEDGANRIRSGGLELIQADTLTIVDPEHRLLVWQLPQEGRYFVRLTARTAGPFQVDFISHPDDFPNAAAIGSDLLVIDSEVAATNHAGYDVDTFAFDADENARYEIRTRRTSGQTKPTDITLRDELGEILFSDQSYLRWTPNESGRYILQVGTLFRGEYSVSVTESFDDAPDTIDSAVPLISPDMTVSGSLDRSGDIDVYRLQNLFQGQQVSFEQSTNFRAPVTIELLDVTGSVLSPSIEDSHSTWTLPSSGDSFVRVSTPIRTGNYELNVVVQEADAPDLNQDGVFNAEDIDAIFAAVRTSSMDPIFDLNDDDQVTKSDADFYLAQLQITPGDANLDGQVNFADFLLLSNSFTSNGGWDSGDFDGDGTISFGDFLLLSSNFGRM